MPTHFYIIFIAALIPIIVGMLWYSKALFGNTWMRINRFNPDEMKSGNMFLLFGLVYVLSVFIAVGLMPYVIHQMGLMSLIADDQSSAANKAWFDQSIATYGHKFRTFKHGALHGTIAGLAFALPVIGICALFEKRGAKYIFIHAGFWVVCMALMGGVICQWL